jgi:hypothetical protein
MTITAAWVVRASDLCVLCGTKCFGNGEAVALMIIEKRNRIHGQSVADYKSIARSPHTGNHFPEVLRGRSSLQYDDSRSFHFLAEPASGLHFCASTEGGTISVPLRVGEFQYNMRTRGHANAAQAMLMLA